MPAPPQSFSQRIVRRRELWWGRSAPLHRARERLRLRSRDDPEDVWRCCDAWPRTLLAKYNARELAARHGCRLPELYWHGSRPARAPLEQLGGDFVLRPLTGFARQGVQVVAGGRELLRGEPAAPDEVRARWPRGRLGRPRHVLLEARVRPVEPDRALPIELKLHAFAGTVAAIERNDRRDARRAAHRYYTPDWATFDDPMNTEVALDGVVEAPAVLEEMLARGERISAAIGTYMRIDFFDGADGLVFNEFAATPGVGLFTPYCDELFGRLWAEHARDAL